jgi:hypothetical protein
VLTKAEVGESQRTSLSACTLIIGIVKLGFQARPHLFVSLSKHLLDGSSPVTIFDVWIIFTLSGSAILKSKAYSLLLKLIHLDRIDKAIIVQALHLCGIPLDSLFGPILELAHKAIGSKQLVPSSSRVVEFGALIIMELYKEF